MEMKCAEKVTLRHLSAHSRVLSFSLAPPSSPPPTPSAPSSLLPGAEEVVPLLFSKAPHYVDHRIYHGIL